MKDETPIKALEVTKMRGLENFCLADSDEKGLPALGANMSTADCLNCFQRIRKFLSLRVIITMLLTKICLICKLVDSVIWLITHRGFV